MWTRRCSTWWPPAHTVSGDPAAITFESHAGGRIMERGRDGAEHDWGRVLDWEPPTRLRYLWHLFFDPREATEVELTFTAVPAGTAVRLEQRGWDKLGEAASPRRERTGQVWGRAHRRVRARVRERARPKVTAAADQTAAISRASDQAGGGVRPMCLTVTVPVLSGWRLPGA